MGHGLQLVVDEQLGSHHDEAEGQEEAIHGPKDKAVPSLQQLVIIFSLCFSIDLVFTLCSLYITE